MKKILIGEFIIPLILKTNIYSITCERDKRQLKLKIMGMVGRSVSSMNEMQDLYYLFKGIIDQIKEL